VRAFRLKIALEDAIGSQVCSLEAIKRVTNGIHLGLSLSYRLTLLTLQILLLKHKKRRASRLVGLIAVATANRWQTRVDREGRLSTEYISGCEELEEVRKVRCTLELEEVRKMRIMLQAGMGAAMNSVADHELCHCITLKVRIMLQAGMDANELVTAFC
jgi:hypothetical protein